MVSSCCFESTFVSSLLHLDYCLASLMPIQVGHDIRPCALQDRMTNGSVCEVLFIWDILYGKRLAYPIMAVMDP